MFVAGFIGFVLDNTIPGEVHTFLDNDQMKSATLAKKILLIYLGKNAQARVRSVVSWRGRLSSPRTPTPRTSLATTFPSSWASYGSRCRLVASVLDRISVILCFAPILSFQSKMDEIDPLSSWLRDRHTEVVAAELL